jgi:hypothetical protein
MPTITRRTFITLSTAATALSTPRFAHAASNPNYNLVAAQDRTRILRLAAQWLGEKPQTITAFPAPDSPNKPPDPHDFFSESDYFWPNPSNPTGPYKEIDGKSNPDNFQGHRRAMIRLSQAMPALTSGFVLTHNKAYGRAAAAHLLAWFVTPETRMNPNLEYAQGVRNGVHGRSYGIIDTLHLVEVARAAGFVKQFLKPQEFTALQQWFRDYLLWLNTSPNGIKERDATNNHGICWALQAAEFARLAGDETTRAEVRARFIDVQLPMQMAPNGSFPRETARTKPYGYSIFNFDCAAALCVSLSSATNPGAPCPDSRTWDRGEGCGELLRFALPDGRGMCRAAEFLVPYLADKSKWPFAHDVQHWESWPVRSPGLLFCGLACAKPDYIALWKKLDPDPTDPEVIRNFPIRQPLLWV